MLGRKIGYSEKNNFDAVKRGIISRTQAILGLPQFGIKVYLTNYHPCCMALLYASPFNYQHL